MSSAVSLVYSASAGSSTGLIGLIRRQAALRFGGRFPAVGIGLIASRGFGAGTSISFPSMRCGVERDHAGLVGEQRVVSARRPGSTTSCDSRTSASAMASRSARPVAIALQRR